VATAVILCLPCSRCHKPAVDARASMGGAAIRAGCELCSQDAASDRRVAWLARAGVPTSVDRRRPSRTTHDEPDPSLLDDVVASKVLAAMKTASTALTALGIRHVVVGGLAVGANGYPRATRDVRFLVGAEAFEHHPGGIVTMKGGVPVQVNGVAIDLLSVQAGEEHLAAALEAPMGSMIEAVVLIPTQTTVKGGTSDCGRYSSLVLLPGLFRSTQAT
jgi:hypothetical protein